MALVAGTKYHRKSADPSVRRWENHEKIAADKPTYQDRLFSKLDYRLGLTALG